MKEFNVALMLFIVVVSFIVLFATAKGKSPQDFKSYHSPHIV